MGEIREEWKNSSVLPVYKKGDKQAVENYRRISLLTSIACYKLYSKMFIEELKAQEEMLLWNVRMDSKRQILHRSII
jgi:hypothetical protein